MHVHRVWVRGGKDGMSRGMAKGEEGWDGRRIVVALAAGYTAILARRQKCTERFLLKLNHITKKFWNFIIYFYLAEF